jgi:nucleobase transporter 1/2
MGNSFYFLPITLSIVNAPRIIDIPDPHEVTDPGTSDLRNSPFHLYICGLSLSLCLRAFETLLTNEDFFAPFSLQRFRHAMRATQGAFIAGSVLNIILGFSGLWGIAAR